MKTREELQKIIADATAELERLDKEPTLWVPENGGKYFYVDEIGAITSDVRKPTVMSDVFPRLAQQGGIARAFEQADWIADFRRVTVPKCKAPEMGQRVYILDEDLDARMWKWGDSHYDWFMLNTGRLKHTHWTPDEIEEYRRIMTTNTDWRFM